MTGWTVTGALNTSLVGGALEFFNPAGQPGGTLRQDTGAPFAASETLELRLDLGNPSGVRKRVRLHLRDSAGDEFVACTFWLAANAPLQPYTLQAQLASAWASVVVELDEATSDGSPALRVDNLALERVARSPHTTRCLDPAAPAPGVGAPSGNLLVNADFSQGMTGWQTHGPLTAVVADGVLTLQRSAGGSQNPAVLQQTLSGAPVNTPLNLGVDLRNPGALPKPVLLIVHDNDWSDLQACWFWLPAQSSLARYRMRTHTTADSQPWTGLTFALYDLVYIPGQPLAEAIRMDNVWVELAPAMTVTGTTCYAPGATIP